ncbi:MAG: hypothetical protein ACOX6S_11340 [Clostridia bacterium]|jgi:hypothetical protein
MDKSQMIRIVGLALCLLLLTSTATFASDPLIQKQQEVDRYFAEHQKELEDKGIIMTYTGVDPEGEFVEVAILEYTEEKADYLYELFGREQIKVVPGEEIVLLTTEADASEPAAGLGDIPVEDGQGEEGALPSRGLGAILQRIWLWLKGIFGIK